MSADEISPEHEWPLPPAWMWECDRCTDLYRTMRRVLDEVAEARLTGERGIDWDPFDSSVTRQMVLGEHMAAEHVTHLPDWSSSCDTCTYHQERIARAKEPGPRADTAVRQGDEHRARHVYAPPSSVGFL
ncbi:hypothetical protein [Streptomyces vilmorinianum]|uniref:hypothetical protein n=1 Tax=Streptomyces vilmorinianum TaxID=3051092 RepID=UPI0010FB932D|nr:hypothetical protein [Streptomyces vilmorinianum]